MKVKLTIPEYLSVGNLQKLSNIEHLTELEKLITTISVITDTSMDDVRSWDTSVIPKIYKDVTTVMDPAEQFHPVFKHEDILYGYQNVDKMSLGEYVDLENLCKDPIANLHEILAILYRPIKKHNFNNLIFKTAHKFLIAKGKDSNVLKHYSLEKYDNETRQQTAEKFLEMPIQYGLGAMGFFLGYVGGYLSSTLPSSTIPEKENKMMLLMTNLQLLARTGVGLAQFTHSPKAVSLTSQETQLLPM